jgi:hypothetical protein
MAGMRPRLTKRTTLWGGACAVVLGAAAAGGAAAAQSSNSASPATAKSPVAKTPAAKAPTTRSPAAETPGPLPSVAIGVYTGTKPSEIDFSADGGNIVTGIRWLSWTPRDATGRGTSGIESCVPDCAEGAVTYAPTTIRFSVPLGGKFTVLTETREGKTITKRYPVTWPIAAS